jgi:Ca-activated chloride channel homolog
MTFEWPWMMLFALVAVPLAARALALVDRRRAARRAQLAALGLVSPEALPAGAAGPAPPPPGRWRRLRPHVPAALLLAALVVLLVSLARPQATIAQAHREGTVVLAFDVSGSMAATDLTPTRLDAAKAAARAFVRRQPPTVKVGVVAFGSTGLITQRPTTDKASVLAAVDRLTPQGGTAVGGGILTSLSAISGKPLQLPDLSTVTDDTQLPDLGFHGSAAIVLLTDGENTADPDPLAVANVASSVGVKVYPIGLGSPAGTVVQIGGFQVATKLDEALLQQIAKTTNGQYFAAADQQELVDVYSKINPTWTVEAKRTEITGLLAALAGLLVLAGAGLSFAWFGRVI